MSTNLSQSIKRSMDHRQLPISVVSAIVKGVTQAWWLNVKWGQYLGVLPLQCHDDGLYDVVRVTQQDDLAGHFSIKPRRVVANTCIGSSVLHDSLVDQNLNS
jgi:hypothetical protein